MATGKTIPTTTPAAIRPWNAVVHTFKTPPSIDIRPTPRPNSATHTTTPRLSLTIHPEFQFTITFPLSPCGFIFDCTNIANTNHPIW